MQYSIEVCPVYQDKRGILAEFVDETFLKQAGLPFGQVYYLSFEGQGIIRGNHYHRHSSEMFCVIYGEVEITLEDVETRERKTIILRANAIEVQKIFIGPKIAHTLKSLTDFAMVLSYSSVVYNPEQEDKIPYVLEG